MYVVFVFFLHFFLLFHHYTHSRTVIGKINGPVPELTAGPSRQCIGPFRRPKSAGLNGMHLRCPISDSDGTGVRVSGRLHCERRAE